MTDYRLKIHTVNSNFTLHIMSIDEAKEAFISHRDSKHTCYGASDMKKGHGTVRCDAGKIIGEFSYNGQWIQK